MATQPKTMPSRRSVLGGLVAVAAAARADLARAQMFFTTQALSAVRSLAVILPGSGQTALGADLSTVPAGNMVTVTNPSTSVVPLQYSL